MGYKVSSEDTQRLCENELVECLFKLQKKFPSWYIHTINTDRDHIHLLLECPPSYAIATVVQKIKVVSSLTLKSKFRFIKKIYSKGSVWSTGYYVSTVGLNEKTSRNILPIKERQITRKMLLPNIHEKQGNPG